MKITPEFNTILLVEDKEDLRKRLVDLLQDEGFRVILAASSEDTLKRVYEEIPHLIILDLTLPENSGYEACKRLKQDLLLRHIPIIMLTEGKDIEERALGLGLDADEYVLKSSEPTELLARISLALGHTYRGLDINPLTRLPGNNSILKRTEEILDKKIPFAICYLDLDNFKSFNDEYGFNRGDDVIRFTSGLIIKAVKELGDSNDFIGHTGGDDFVIITQPERIDKLCSKIINGFDAAVPQFYDQEVRRQGHIIRMDRRGNLIKVPIISVSIAVVTNEKRQLFHIGQISRLATELKDYAKSFPGSIYFKDRRGQRICITSNLSKEDLTKRYEEMQVGAEKRIGQRSKKIQALREIIQKETIDILFQPIVHFSSKSIIGYEALMRGPQDTELRSPEVLFDLAREGDMLWQLDRLCRKKIFQFGKDFSNMALRLFVNTTPESIYDPEFQQMQLPKDCPLKQEDLVIEITERGMVEDFDKFYEILSSIQKRKIKIAIDDAGSGYVSLRDVAKLKPDYIKIDMSVIRNIDVDKVRQDVLSTWFSFAQRIDSELITEGIETKEEYNFLLDVGISLGQGYLFAKPGKPYPKLNEESGIFL
jgi:EAL domain-containing protein (putative c-di-GMP-specific phosphodiesterase class I)/CheY-like chemotaxis protein